MNTYEVLGASILLLPLMLCVSGLIVYYLIDLWKKTLSPELHSGKRLGLEEF